MKEIKIPSLFNAFFSNFTEKEKLDCRKALIKAMKPYLDAGWIDNSWDICFSVKNPQNGEIQYFDWRGRCASGFKNPKI